MPWLLYTKDKTLVPIHILGWGGRERENNDLTLEFSCQLRIIRDKENRDTPFKVPEI
jgi:hypothetical protein